VRNLAVVSLESGRYDEALRYADALAALPPATGFLDEVPVLRFYAHRGLGDFERAEQAYAATERGDRTRRLRYDRARFAQESGRPERALVDLERLARTPGVAPGVVRLLGEVYHALGDYDGMVRAYEYLHREDAGDREALVSLIAAHAALGEREEAEAYRELLRALPAATDSRDR
jgi:tetratricopeptide (TPR) repeat protein